MPQQDIDFYMGEFENMSAEGAEKLLIKMRQVWIERGLWALTFKDLRTLMTKYEEGLKTKKTAPVEKPEELNVKGESYTPFDFGPWIDG